MVSHRMFYEISKGGGQMLIKELISELALKSQDKIFKPN
jgi:hypothetical protein